MIELPQINITDEYIEIRKVEERRPGIYFLYSANKELMYVGKAGNMKVRLNQHINKSTNHIEIHSAYRYARWAVIFCPVDRDIYETWYINKLKPPINRNKTFTYETRYHDYKEDYETREQQAVRQWMERRIEKSMESFSL